MLLLFMESSFGQVLTLVLAKVVKLCLQNHPLKKQKRGSGKREIK